MAASASSSSSATGVSWDRVLPTPRAATAAELEAVRARFGVPLPAQLESLLLHHGGDMATPSAFVAQNVQTGLWRRERMGPLYPVVASAATSGEEGQEEAAYPDLAQVNEMFLDELLQQDDDVDEPAVSRKKKQRGDGAEAAAAAAAPKAKRAPFFAFAECSSGLVLVLETRSMAIMLLDLTGRRGPWIAGESFDDFWQRVAEGGVPVAEAKAKGKGKAAAAAASEPEVEFEEEGDDDDEYGDDDMGDDDGDMYACDECMAELPPSVARFHCDQCKCYDLCQACMDKANKTKPTASAAAASSSGAAKKGRQVAESDDAHPASHTFTLVEPREQVQEDDEDEEEEEEEKVSAPKKGSNKKK